MKRTLALLLAAITIFACVFAFSSCGLFGGGNGPKPELDLDIAKDNLEDADYTVNYIDDEDEITQVGVVEKLSAYKEDDNITILVFADKKTAKLYFENNYATQYDRYKETRENKIEWIEHILDKYEDDLDADDIDEYEDELKDLKKDLDDVKNKMSYGIKGAVVWYGTAKAAEATK